MQECLFPQQVQLPGDSPLLLLNISVCTDRLFDGGPCPRVLAHGGGFREVLKGRPLLAALLPVNLSRLPNRVRRLHLAVSATRPGVC